FLFFIKRSFKRINVLMIIYIIRMLDINPNMLVEVEDRSVVLSCGNSYVVKYFTGYPQVLKPEELNS
ncbi:hypothetical protein CYK95_14195, partial [Clostridium perfringens]